MAQAGRTPTEISRELNSALRGASFGTLATTWQLGLSTSANFPTDELDNGGSYARQALTFEKSGGGASSSGAPLQNVADVVFEIDQDEDLGVATHGAIIDDQSRVLFIGPLSSPIDFSAPHNAMVVTFAAGGIVVSAADND